MTTLTPSGVTTTGRAWTSLVLGVLIFGVPLAFSMPVDATDYVTFAWSNYATGVLVVVFAAICVWAAKNNLRVLAWLEGLNVLLGVWAIATPFVFPSGTNPMYANIVLGALLAIVAAWDAYVGATNAGGRTTRPGRTT